MPNYSNKNLKFCWKNYFKIRLFRGYVIFLFSLVNPLDVGLVNLSLRGFCSDEKEDLGWKATGVGADKLLVVHSLGLCWICYSQLSSLLLELLPTAQSLCLSFTAQSSPHKSRFHLPCDGVFSRKSVFGKVSPQHSLFCWRKNNQQILPSEHVLSGRDRKRNSNRGYVNTFFAKRSTAKK